MKTPHSSRLTYRCLKITRSEELQQDLHKSQIAHSKVSNE